MGLYTRQLIGHLKESGHEVSILLFKGCRLRSDDDLLRGGSLRYAPYPSESDDVDLHLFSDFLARLLHADNFGVYVDATPFIAPSRLDLPGVAIVAVCYDLIPLRLPQFYLTTPGAQSTYYNGLCRLSHADSLICISNTVSDELERYLGISRDYIVTIYPDLLDPYKAPIASGGAVVSRQATVASVVGFHRSKNPDGAVTLLNKLAGVAEIRINVPTVGQKNGLLAHLQLSPGIKVTADITDPEKLEMQAAADVIVHLSTEEGFGIPLLEALFLGKKVIALDIPVNRELIGSEAASGHVLLLAPKLFQLETQQFNDFLRDPGDPEYYSQLRGRFLSHWRNAPTLARLIVDKAIRNARQWQSSLEFGIFSSIPGTACGVADYTMGYLRAKPANAILFLSRGDLHQIGHLQHTKFFSFRSFDLAATDELIDRPMLFNFAFSPLLIAGVELARHQSRPGDILLIHERQYYDGLKASLEQEGRPEALAEYITSDQAADIKPRRHPVAGNNLEFRGRSTWLERLHLDLVSHLSPQVVIEVEKYAIRSGRATNNDLLELEDQIRYVPMGIDDRSGPQISRQASRLRRSYCMQQDDIVLGHFGLILDDIKLLRPVVEKFLHFADSVGWQLPGGRRLFFVLSGKVIDLALFRWIEDEFAGRGMRSRLVWTNPTLEDAFDANLAMCDAIFCLRLQRRGQQSHAFVRALSLGVPVMTNVESGWAYDSRTTLDVSALAIDIARVVDVLITPELAISLRRSARAAYVRTHRADMSLEAILEGRVAASHQGH